jgi:hypothetical protein
MATVPTTPDLATMASIINTVLRGQVIVKTKIFSLRSRAPDVAPRGGYAMSDGVELVPLDQLSQHLQRLRDTKGEAKGLIPATKEIYQHLVDNHVQTYKVTEDDGDRYAIVPVPYLFAMLRLKEQTRAAHKRRAALRAATGSASARLGRFRQSSSLRGEPSRPRCRRHPECRGFPSRVGLRCNARVG